MFSETLYRMRQFVFVACILVPLAFFSTVLPEKFPLVYDQPVINAGSLDILLENCSGNVPFSEEDFRRCFPPPPSFTVPPPPPFIASDSGATYSWQLVRNSIASSPGDRDVDNCSEQAVQRITTPHETLSTSAPPPPPTPGPNKTKQTKYNETERGEETEALGRTEKEKEKDTKKKNDNRKEKVGKEKSNQRTPRTKTTKAKSEFLADVTTCADDDSDNCNTSEKKGRKKGRKTRGIPGPPGPPGPPGTNGADGLPGLVVFPDAAAMFGVSLEGLIAYRKDVKQLFVRDHLTWRPIRVAKCGDGIVDRDAGEHCDDGNDDIHDDCLGCRRSSCGDGIRNRRTEECDGRDFGDKTCTTYREGMTGPLTCTPECQISYQRCRHKRYVRR